MTAVDDVTLPVTVTNGMTSSSVFVFSPCSWLYRGEGQLKNNPITLLDRSSQSTPPMPSRLSPCHVLHDLGVFVFLLLSMFLLVSFLHDLPITSEFSPKFLMLTV